MAKLSARNRKELWRMEKVTVSNEDPDYTKKKTTFVYTSDGHLLKNSVAWLKPRLSYLFDPPRMHSERKDSGWKDRGFLDNVGAGLFKAKLLSLNFVEVLK